MKNDTLTTAKIRKAIKLMAAVSNNPPNYNAFVASQLYGVLPAINSQSIGKTIFNDVQDQVNRYKKNVISREALRSKHDVLLKEVNKEIDDFMLTEEHKEFIHKAFAGCVRRAILRTLYSKEFKAKLDKAAREVLANGIK